MEEKKALISFCKADIAGGDNVVIYDLDMEVYPGDFVYIVGKVGSGKTCKGTSDHKRFIACTADIDTH